MGTVILAKKGHKYDEILNHYYNASLCNINKRGRHVAKEGRIVSAVEKAVRLSCFIQSCHCDNQ